MADIQETNDLGTALIAMAFLDNILMSLLKGYFINNTKKVNQLLKDGPLETFYSRIMICYCLGLINEEQRYDLDIIRRIRNKFAHTFETITFDEILIKDLIKSLKQIRRLESLDYYEEYKKSNKFIFVICVALLSNSLLLKCLSVKSVEKKKKENSSIKQKL